MGGGRPNPARRRRSDLWELGPNACLAELQVVRFIRDALRARERAILVTGGELHVPKAALAACETSSVRTLHLRPPLPGPDEMQEMIGAAFEIAGGSGMHPLAMAARLLFSDLRQTVILAIDDAHTLSLPSLSYLMDMTELLAPDAPVLQIVLAAKPNSPRYPCSTEIREFSKSALSTGIRAAVPNFGRGKIDVADPGPLYVTAAAMTQAQSVDLPAWPGSARSPKSYAGVVAMTCLAAISFGYLVFDAFSPIRSLVSASLERLSTASAPAQLPNKEVMEAAASRQTIKATETLPPTPPGEDSTKQNGAAGNGVQAFASPSAAAPASTRADRDQNFVAPEFTSDAASEVATKGTTHGQTAEEVPPDDLSTKAASLPHEEIREPARPRLASKPTSGNVGRLARLEISTSPRSNPTEVNPPPVPAVMEAAPSLRVRANRTVTSNAASVTNLSRSRPTAPFGSVRRRQSARGCDFRMRCIDARNREKWIWNATPLW